MTTDMMSYRVCYKKEEDGAEVIMDVKTDSLEQVYSSICSMAGVKDTMDLAYLEIHAIRLDGNVEITTQTSEAKPTLELEEQDSLRHKLESSDDDWELLSVEALIEEEQDDD